MVTNMFCDPYNFLETRRQNIWKGIILTIAALR